jgi:hypothetical protein
MPRYSDYHRTVIGYHGTKRETALQIIQGNRAFEPSQNNDDWLGHGVYFWEYAPQQAYLWAKKRQHAKKWDDEIAVVGSMIRLGFCFDLLDPENVKNLGHLYQEYVKTLAESPDAPPVNVMAKKWMNCAVFNFAYAWLEIQQPAIDTCRAVFVPTTKKDRIWSGSGINAHAHIQICVRNPDCILGTWLVKPTEEQDRDREESPEAEQSFEQHDDPSSGESPPERFT